MAVSTIKHGQGYNNPAYKTFQIDSLVSDSDDDILAELAAHEEAVKCSAASSASNATLNLICVKKNDGTWQINRY